MTIGGGVRIRKASSGGVIRPRFPASAKRKDFLPRQRNHQGKLFKEAFPQPQGDAVTYDNIAKAIEAFEATLRTPDSPFDKYLKGDSTALSRVEQDGLKLFMDKGCAGCHGGINMGGTGYFPFGVVEKPQAEITAGDTGRFKVTGAKYDEYVFKSQSLRNIALTAPYFHSGKVWSLTAAVTIMGSSQLGISLSDSDVESIVAFLSAASGEQLRIEYPRASGEQRNHAEAQVGLVHLSDRTRVSRCLSGPYIL